MGRHLDRESEKGQGRRPELTHRGEEVAPHALDGGVGALAPRDLLDTLRQALAGGAHDHLVRAAGESSRGRFEAEERSKGGFNEANMACRCWRLPPSLAPQRLELLGLVLAPHHVDGLDATVLGQLQQWGSASL